MEIHSHIELADKTKFECDYLTTIPEGFMFIAVKNSLMGDIANAFDNEANTSSIKYGDHILKNYVLMNIKKEGESRYKIALRKKFADEV